MVSSCFCCGKNYPLEELPLIIELGSSRSKVRYCDTCQEAVIYFERLIQNDPHQVLGFDYASVVADEPSLDECIGLEGEPNPLLRIQIAQRAIALAINKGNDNLPDFHRNVIESGFNPGFVLDILARKIPELITSG